MSRTIFTIGHSNHTLHRFLELLLGSAIDVVVDTRSQPYSNYSPQYNGEVLRLALENRGIRYVFLGEQLGGRPTNVGYYDEQGHVLYSKVAEDPKFKRGIDKLEKAVVKHKVVLLCSEENPCVCHRKLLVGRVLLERGMQVLHIRGDGRVVDSSDLDTPIQAELFGEETQEWKSLQSVLHKRPQTPSSTR